MDKAHDDMLNEVIDKTKKYQVHELGADIRKYDAAFAKIDKDNDGFIEKKDLLNFAKERGISVEESTVEGVCHKFDINGNGTVTLQEFLQVAVFNSAYRYWKETLIDTTADDPTKGLTMDDLDFLDMALVDPSVIEKLSGFDQNNDGFIDNEEFQLYLWEDVKAIFSSVKWFKDFLLII